MTDETDQLFRKISVKLHDQRQKEKQTLDDIAGKVFDAYRAALGDDFTTQEVIRASTYGSDIRDWDAISPEMQDTLWALCARYPESVDREKVSTVLSDSVVEYLFKKGLYISNEQAQLFPDLMKDIMQGLEQIGVKFGNDVRKARILGIEPLSNYLKWLVSGGQMFMNFDQYDLELKLTQNTIRAYQDVFTTALVTARDVEVNYGITRERVEGIVEASIKVDGSRTGSLFVVAYKTNNGKEGEIDVLKTLVTSLTEKSDENRIRELFHEKKINPDGPEGLGYEGSIDALVGLPENISQELRAYPHRQALQVIIPHAR